MTAHNSSLFWCPILLEVKHLRTCVVVFVETKCPYQQKGKQYILIISSILKTKFDQD